MDEGLRFIVRQDGDRHVLLPGGETRAVAEAARWAATTIVRTITVEHEGHRESRELRLGEVAVRLPERPEAPLWRVVIRGLGANPIMLLTNVPPDGKHAHPPWIADCYLPRWRGEEAYRFVKQGCHLEDVRVRGYVARRNICALVQAVFYFVSAVLGRRAKLNLIFSQVCAKAQRFYEIATFFHYAVADGIHRLLWGAKPRPIPPAEPPDTDQLLLAFAPPPG